MCWCREQNDSIRQGAWDFSTSAYITLKPQNMTDNTQYKQCLEFILPGSPVFDFLEGLVTRPADTYLTLAEITEREEKEKINKEIANRRSRLSATKGNISLEVRLEVLGASPVREDITSKEP